MAHLATFIALELQLQFIIEHFYLQWKDVGPNVHYHREEVDSYCFQQQLHLGL